VSTKDARIYCVTFPCSFCCKAIIQCGIRSVTYEEDYNDDLSKTLFEEAGIDFRQIIPT
jgi:dCMP deaminase